MSTPLPSLGQYDLQSPDAGLAGSIVLLSIRAPRPFSKGRPSVRGKKMRYAETGFNLEVDLTRGNIERIETDPRDSELYLGGLGTNAKIKLGEIGRAHV